MATEFRLLGDIEVHVDGRIVDIGHARRRCVLAVLLAGANRVLSADELIGRVWGQRGLPGDPRNTLHTYISLLRRLLAAAGDVNITLQAGGYKLAADATSIDMHRFGALIRQARGSDDDAHAAALLQEALGLWRGDPFARLDTPWINSARAALAAQRHTAQLELADAQLRLGQHAVVVARMSGLIAAYPLDEELAGQYMTALYRSGRRSDALAHYQLIRQRLAGELGTEPGPALRLVREQVRRADQSLGGQPSGGSPALEAPREAPRQLPMDVVNFVGHDLQLAKLDRLLTSAASLRKGRQFADGKAATALAVIYGLPGAGKTSLAVHWAHQVAQQFPDGQLYVNLHGYDPGPPVTAEEALGGFLRALGVPRHDIPAGPAERAAMFRSLLASRQMLLLLDNASRIGQVRPLLPGNPACVTVVTSRSWLTGLGARDGALCMDIGPLSQQEAVGLLRGLIGPRPDASPALLAALAEQCGGLPLALRMAAELAPARLAIPLAQLAADLADPQRRLDVLEEAEDPQSSLRAVFSWSVRQLDPATRAVFLAAGLHPGADISAHEAAALAGITVGLAGQALDRLSRASLIRDTAPGRYAMHDLLRAYARELATAQPPAALLPHGTAAPGGVAALPALTSTLSPLGGGAGHAAHALLRACTRELGTPDRGRLGVRAGPEQCDFFRSCDGFAGWTGWSRKSMKVILLVGGVQLRRGRRITLNSSAVRIGSIPGASPADGIVYRATREALIYAVAGPVFPVTSCFPEI
jgi:DNA-binding SARP family transcriptional activator